MKKKSVGRPKAIDNIPCLHCGKNKVNDLTGRRYVCKKSIGGCGKTFMYLGGKYLYRDVYYKSHEDYILKNPEKDFNMTDESEEKHLPI